MKRVRLISQLILASLLILVTACQKNDSSDWVIKVNNKPISEADLQLRWSNVSAEAQKQISDPINFVINDLVKNEIFFQEAKREKLDESKDYKAYVKRLTDQYEYQKKQVLVELFLREKIAKNVQVTEKEVAAAYDVNKEEFFSGFQQRAFSHILVKTEADTAEIIKEMNKGVSYDALAKTKSIDVATAKNGGRLPGYYRKNVLNPQLADTVYGLKRIGQISKPVKSNAGYHIFRLDDIQNVKPSTYEQAKGYLQQQIFISRRNEELAKLFNSIKDNYKQTVNPKFQQQQDAKPKAAAEKKG